ncbi:MULTISPECIES: Dabb family protein [Vibrionaceae]|uniref:Dabb family protein n=1 Tax=Vibrionaceae TaxID=641 RepID=UPI00063CD664|nr:MULTISPECIES: Dabb family protein [Vibrionaceae]MDC4168401.1 Dabb family protein [Photobacterium damselae]
MIKRIIMLKFKVDAEQQAISDILSKMESLPSKIDGITSVDSGVDQSPEGMNKGFTHIVQLTFENKDARDSYLPHPDHESIKQICMPILEDMLVFDCAV